MVVFLLDWIMATHLKPSFHHQSMRKWGVNTLVFIQHSFIFLPEAKTSSAAQRDQLIYRIFFKALKSIFFFLMAQNTNDLLCGHSNAISSDLLYFHELYYIQLFFLSCLLVYWNCNMYSKIFYNWEGLALKLQTAHPYDHAKGAGNGKTPGSL